jgi:hypothetical protein
MLQNHHSNANQYYINTTTLELITTQYYIPNYQSMLPNPAQYSTYTPPMLHQCAIHIGNTSSMLLNTRSLNLNATKPPFKCYSILNFMFALQCYLMLQMLPKLNATKTSTLLNATNTTNSTGGYLEMFNTAHKKLKPVVLRVNTLCHAYALAQVLVTKIKLHATPLQWRKNTPYNTIAKLECKWCHSFCILSFVAFN